MDDIEDKPMQKSEPGTPLREETVGEAAERVALRKREERSLLWKIDLLRESRSFLSCTSSQSLAVLSCVGMVGSEIISGESCSAEREGRRESELDPLELGFLHSHA